MKNFYKSVVVALFGLLLLGGQVNGQNSNEWICGTQHPQNMPAYTPDNVYSNSSNTWLNKYRTPGYWIPTSNTPIKTILLDWVICQDDNGNNGWKDTPALRAQFQRTIDSVNVWYGQIPERSYDLTCESNGLQHITDSRIRFELNRVIFIKNDSMNSTFNGSAAMLYLKNTDPDYGKVMYHIYSRPMMLDSSAAGRYEPNNGVPYVISFYSMQDTTTAYTPFSIHHCSHEYGHSVGLYHTYGGEITEIAHYDFLDDLFGVCPESTACTSTPMPGHVCYFKKTFLWQFPNSSYPLMGGQEKNRFISPKCAGRMHRDLSHYDNKFLVFNKGIDAYVKEKYSYEQPKIISENEIWDFAIKMYQDIVIEPGVTLTVTGKVKMPIDGKIIVKQGAKLLLDGGVLTAAHDLPWTGVEVWGDVSHNQQQTDENGNKYQGEIELKNDALIEKAKVAVDLSRNGDATSYGGIIKANDSKFINNGQSVHFYPYNNFNANFPNYNNNYISWFNNCTFSLDNDYSNVVQFNNHIEFEGNKGISISGCTFGMSSVVTNKIPQYKAIDVYNSSVFVDWTCQSNVEDCPDNAVKRSYFSNFYVAIFSNNSSLYVDKSNFIANNYGVVLQNSLNSNITRSLFQMGPSEDCSVGIKIDNTLNFTIQENIFDKNPFGANGVLYGIIVKKSQGSNDIYKNVFRNLNYANFFDKHGMPNDGIVGIHCNGNKNNYADFYSKNDDQILAGTHLIPSGNNFSQDENTYHLYKLSGIYYYNQNSSLETPINVVGTTIYPVNAVNSCPSHLNDNNHIDRVLSVTKRANIEQEYLDNYTTYTQTKNLYNDLQDGGNTTREILDIESAQANDMWVLREQLLGHSPHLSLQVLKKTIDRKDILPPTAIFDILKANPDELRTEVLFDYIKEKGNILPDYMLSILRNVANGITYKTALINQMNTSKSNYISNCNKIVASIIADEQGTEEQLRQWLDNMHNIDADRQIVASFIRENNFENALTLANLLPELYNMKADELYEQEAYILLLNKYKDIAESGRSLFELTDVEKQWFDAHINEYDGTISASLAKSTLKGVFGDSDAGVFDCPNPDSYNPMGAIVVDNNIDSEKVAHFYGLKLQAEPNPATNWVNFAYNLPENVKSAELIIQNNLGQIVKRFQLNESQNQILWDCRALPAGAYQCTIAIDDLIINEKVVISK